MASSVVMQLTIPVGQKMSTALMKLIMQSAFKVIKRGQQKKGEKNPNTLQLMILQFYGESNFTGYSNVSFDLLSQW